MLNMPIVVAGGANRCKWQPSSMTLCATVPEFPVVIGEPDPDHPWSRASKSHLTSRCSGCASASIGEPLSDDREDSLGLVLEEKAAVLRVNDQEIEPLRGILFRSASTLPVEAGKLRAAERLACVGMIGAP